MPGLEDNERSQSRFAKRSGVSQTFISQLERGEKNLANYSLDWFERYAPLYGWTTEEMLEALELHVLDGKVRPTRATEASGIPREERSILFRRIRMVMQARRLERECGGDVSARIRRAFLLVVGREPDDGERQATERFLEIQRAAFPGQPDSEKRVWADFCQTLFGLNAFLYIE